MSSRTLTMVHVHRRGSTAVTVIQIMRMTASAIHRRRNRVIMTGYKKLFRIHIEQESIFLCIFIILCTGARGQVIGFAHGICL